MEPTPRASDRLKEEGYGRIASDILLSNVEHCIIWKERHPRPVNLRACMLQGSRTDLIRPTTTLENIPEPEGGGAVEPQAGETGLLGSRGA